MRKVFQIVGGFFMVLALMANSQALGEAGLAKIDPGSNQSRSADAPLPAPKGIRAIPRVGAVTVQWRAVAGSQGYRIYWAKGGQVACFSAQVSEVGPGQLSCTVSSLLPGVSYGFKVCSVRSCREGLLSRKVSATPRGIAQVKPGIRLALEKASEGDWIDRLETAPMSKAFALPPPKGFRGIPLVEGALLQWKPMAGSTGYRVYWEFEAPVSRCSNGIEDLGPDQVSYQLGELTPGVSYRFRVCTLKDSHEGPMSREVAVSPQKRQAIEAGDGAP